MAGNEARPTAQGGLRCRSDDQAVVTRPPTGCAVEKAVYVFSVCGGCLTTTVTVQNTALAARLGPIMLRRAASLTPQSKLLKSYPLHFKPRVAGEVSSQAQASANLLCDPNVDRDACRVSASQAGVQKQAAREVTRVPTAVCLS